MSRQVAWNILVQKSEIGEECRRFWAWILGVNFLGGLKPWRHKTEHLQKQFAEKCEMCGQFSSQRLNPNPLCRISGSIIPKDSSCDSRLKGSQSRRIAALSHRKVRIPSFAVSSRRNHQKIAEREQGGWYFALRGFSLRGQGFPFCSGKAPRNSPILQVRAEGHQLPDWHWPVWLGSSGELSHRKRENPVPSKIPLARIPFAQRLRGGDAITWLWAWKFHQK